jgi:hypothetical protein
LEETVNIYELEKQTSVGPARSVFTLRTDAEALMRIHCRNHFLKALEALKRVQRNIGPTEPVQDELETVIAELEDVK